MGYKCIFMYISIWYSLINRTLLLDYMKSQKIKVEVTLDSRNKITLNKHVSFIFPIV